MKLAKVACVALLLALSAAVARADGADPTVVINHGPDPTVCPAGDVCVSDLSDASVSLPEGPFSITIDYTGTAAISGLDMLFVNPGASISCQTDIFKTCSSLPEIVGGLPALLLELGGAGPCMSNGDNPPTTCPGVISAGELLTLSSPQGFATPKTVSFVPEPGSLMLLLNGASLLGGLALRRYVAKHPY
jgi:hypothetical protein